MLMDGENRKFSTHILGRKDGEVEGKENMF